VRNTGKNRAVSGGGGNAIQISDDTSGTRRRRRRWTRGDDGHPTSNKRRQLNAKAERSGGGAERSTAETILHGCDAAQDPTMTDRPDSDRVLR